MAAWMIEVRDAAGEWWTVGRDPFEADDPEAALAEYRRQSGDVETRDDRIRAVAMVEG